MIGKLSGHGRALATIAVVAIFSCNRPARAEQVIDRALSDVSVVTRKSCSLIRIGFNFRVRYISHFPGNKGRALRIRLRAIDKRVALSQIITRREALRAPKDRRAAISSIEFETRQVEGPTLNILFKHAVSYKVAQGADFQSIILAISGKRPSRKCKAVFPRRSIIGPWSTKVSTVARTTRSDDGKVILPRRRRRPGKISAADLRKAGAAMDEARAALKHKKNSQAVKLLSKVLSYPEHKYSAEAQELMGLARQRMGQLALARGEYKDYLRRYGKGADADRIRQRLNAISPQIDNGRPAKYAKSTKRWNRKKKDREKYWSVAGSLSQFYIRDDSFRKYVDPSLPPDFNRDPDDHQIYQNALLSSLDFTAIWNNAWSKSKIRFSGTQEHDFDGDEANIVGVSALYLDTTLKDLGLQARLGRQTRNTGGVLGRFDGGVLSWQATPLARFNVVAGSPVHSRKYEPFRHDSIFYGASVDVGSLFEGLDMSAFAIEQRTEGYLDRRAIGFEARYFDTTKSGFLTTDYDVYYNRLNTFLLNGSWILPDKSTISASFDYRTSPYLLTYNALQGQQVSTLHDLGRLYTKEQIEKFALDRTAVAKTASIGYSRPLSKTVQVSLDATVANISGTKQSGNVPASASTGNEFYYGAQLIANDLFTKGDTGIFGIRFADRKTTDSLVLDFNLRYPVTPKLRINPRLRFSYQYSNVNDMSEYAVLPSGVLNYYLTKDLSLELEVGGRFSRHKQGTARTNENEFYFTVGYRYDFYKDSRR